AGSWVRSPLRRARRAAMCWRACAQLRPETQWRRAAASVWSAVSAVREKVCVTPIGFSALALDSARPRTDRIPVTTPRAFPRRVVCLKRIPALCRAGVQAPAEIIERPVGKQAQAGEEHHARHDEQE